MSNFAVIATIKLTAGSRDAFVEHLVRHRERSLSGEPGTLAFEILVPHDEPDTVLLYEVYTDEVAFDAHMSGSSITTMRRDTSPMVISLTGIRCTPAT